MNQLMLQPRNALLGCALLVATASAVATEIAETGPVPLAANFSAQFFKAKPSDVQVTILEETAQHAKARIEVDGQSCRMSMALAPAGSRVPFGWLVESMICDK
ncbi:hypothetical protein [Pseudomonas sp.]|uniref:hypothetical protein n=1 Tax=Pseudomonas sp. TaxID=306 RepID=UPI00290D0D59|nr:hypothetical protein [Pseudomonas sp.]MDU4254542.1 hypothetical protein [Pseudomonas sp.]